MILRLRPRRRLDRPIWSRSPQGFRKAFADLVEGLGFAPKSYLPYALRRGGATFHFQRCKNLVLTLQQGRWTCAKTARIYLDSGTVRVSLRMCPGLDRNVGEFKNTALKANLGGYASEQETWT